MCSLVSTQLAASNPASWAEAAAVRLWTALAAFTPSTAPSLSSGQSRCPLFLNLKSRIEKQRSYIQQLWQNTPPCISAASHNGTCQLKPKAKTSSLYLQLYSAHLQQECICLPSGCIFHWITERERAIKSKQWQDGSSGSSWSNQQEQTYKGRNPY